MLQFLAASLLAGIAGAYPSATTTSAPDFGYVYTAQTEEPGETELTLWATDRRGKGQGHYNAQEYRLEVERGVTDRFQISAYANFVGHHVRGLGGEFEPVDRDLAFSGLEAEFKYKLRDPSHDRLGLAFYVEPGWSRISKVTGQKPGEFELELKAIAQKNFLGDRLTWATNLTLEPEWERRSEDNGPGIAEQAPEKELAVELASAVAYRLDRHWWLGLEGRYHSVYPDWTRGLHRENYAVYAGPTIHFAAGEWSLTGTYQSQLFGGPSNSSSSLELEDHEKREFRLKLSREF